MDLTGVASYQANPVMPNVYHIRDPMNVHVTLLVGQKRALLLDTGYGLFDLRSFVRKLTRLPLTVVCSHGHHDHACGNPLFDQVFLLPEEMDVCRHYTVPGQRLRVLTQADEKGLLPEGYDREAYQMAGPGNICVLPEKHMDLGGMEVQVLPLPGHTPGSLGLLVMPQRLLLIGDNWNPTTWLFFPECERISRYVDTMKGLLPLPFEYVLSPHEGQLLPGGRLRSYVLGLMNKDMFESAWPAPVPPYEHIRTCACRPEPGTLLFFDRDKL